MALRSRHICTLLCLVSYFLDIPRTSSHSQGIVELKIQTGSVHTLTKSMAAGTHRPENILSKFF